MFLAQRVEPRRLVMVLRPKREGRQQAQHVFLRLLFVETRCEHLHRRVVFADRQKQPSLDVGGQLMLGSSFEYTLGKLAGLRARFSSQVFER